MTFFQMNVKLKLLILLTICTVLVPASRKTLNQPLILTEFIEAGEVSKARKLAEVNDFLNVKSYSGYITVKKHLESNLFFWFFPSKQSKSKPVIIWLQGGPGSSSFIGLLYENGPFMFDLSGNIQHRNASWANLHSLLYIENPVGTGFSNTKGNLSRNLKEITDDLYTFILQFYQIFPEYQRNSLYLTGESYAGKYVVDLALKIHNGNKNLQSKINLQGIIIGNGLLDPISQIEYADFLYYLGLFGKKEREIGLKYESRINQNIKLKKYKKSYFLFEEYIGGGLFCNVSYFANVTSYSGYYNYLYRRNPRYQLFQNQLVSFLNRDDIQKKLHSGKYKYNYQNHNIVLALADDFMTSVTDSLTTLLTHYRILIYTGQLDIIVNYPATIKYLSQIKQMEFSKSVRRKWCVEGKLAGYFRSLGNFTEVMIRKAGHMVPKDRPLWTYDLIYRFTRNINLTCTSN